MSQALGITLDAARRFMASDIHARLDRGEADDAELATAISTLAGRPIPEAEARALVLSVFEASMKRFGPRSRGCAAGFGWAASAITRPLCVSFFRRARF